MSNGLSLLFRALEFAAHKHRDQKRKDAEATPYINHPIAVAKTLVEEGGVDDVVTLAAAILHDTIEDTKTTHAELVERFGQEVADVVAEVTDDKRLLKDERKQKQIEKASHLSARAKLVKLADKTCNLRDIVASPPHHWTVERKREYFEWAERVVAAMRAVEGPMPGVFAKAHAAADRLR